MNFCTRERQGTADAGVAGAGASGAGGQPVRRVGKVPHLPRTPARRQARRARGPWWPLAPARSQRLSHPRVLTRQLRGGPGRGLRSGPPRWPASWRSSLGRCRVPPQGPFGPSHLPVTLGPSRCCSGHRLPRSKTPPLRCADPHPSANPLPPAPP